MQELLQVESDLTRMFDSDLRVAMMLLEHLRANKTEMLEKEKGQIIEAHIDGQVEGTLMGGPGPAEYYYQETFNANEK